MDTDKNLNSSTDFKRLRSILDGDGQQIREQFILAGLILTVFERFKEYVINQVDGFFSDRSEIRDGKLTFTRSAEFKRIVKERGVGDPGQHDNRVFRAALHWFFDLGAIDKTERDAIERIYTCQ